MLECGRACRERSTYEDGVVVLVPLERLDDDAAGLIALQHRGGVAVHLDEARHGREPLGLQPHVLGPAAHDARNVHARPGTQKVLAACRHTQPSQSQAEGRIQPSRRLARARIFCGLKVEVYVLMGSTYLST